MFRFCFIDARWSTPMQIDMATVQSVGLVPWLFNLPISPEEQLTVGHRMNAWLASLGAEAKAQAATLNWTAPVSRQH
jgi:arylsulfatase